MTVPVATRDDAMRWIIDHQLGRHNLTEEQKSALRGQRYLLKKTAGHGEAVPQNEGPTTAERLAAEYQVSHATIERDGQFAEGLDALKTVRDALPTSVLTKKTRCETTGKDRPTSRPMSGLGPSPTWSTPS
jgi:hypothetical protein